MGTKNNCCSIHLIDENATLNDCGMEIFSEEVKLAEYGLNYAVVSIMGPQNSGKSTLLNHLFNTNFREMDALNERCQTTKGIWVAKSPNIEPCTLVMDLEGTDGREREENVAFELQSALFALAVSDILLINMWCHDIGRVQASNLPLLRIVFQVMNQLFGSHKVTLLFVLRDKTRTPIGILEPLLQKDIQKIWDSVHKPEAHKDSPLSEFFNVEVVALSNYEEHEDQFQEQVASLRQRLSVQLASDGRDKVPASVFPFSVQEIWKIVKENRDLNIPSHKVMVANVRCEEIASAKLSSFCENEDWCELKAVVQSYPVKYFGSKLSFILDIYLAEYDRDTKYFDEGIRNEKRNQLMEKLVQVIKPTYESMLEHLRSRNLVEFKENLDKALNEGKGFSVAVHDCTLFSLARFEEESIDAIVKQANWNLTRSNYELKRNIESYVEYVRSSKLSLLCSQHEKKLGASLSRQVEDLLSEAVDDTWLKIRNLYRHQSESAVLDYSVDISGFIVDEEMKNEMLSRLENYARVVVENKSRQEAERVLKHLKHRFTEVFSFNYDLKPRVWSAADDIQAIAENAYSEALKLLTMLAAIRLDADFDNIRETLTCSLSWSTISEGLLCSRSWAEVPESQTLLTPIQCKSLWTEFKQYAEPIVANAQEAKERASKSWSSLFVTSTTVVGVAVGAVGATAAGALGAPAAQAVTRAAAQAVSYAASELFKFAFGNVLRHNHHS